MKEHIHVTTPPQSTDYSDFNQTNAIGKIGEGKWAAHLALKGHTDIQHAPDSYHPAWDITSHKAGTVYTFEVKTDSRPSENLFIPYQEKDRLGHWRYSGILHPDLTAGTWVQFRPHHPAFFVADVQALKAYVLAQLDSGRADTRRNTRNQTSECGLLLPEALWSKAVDGRIIPHKL